MENKFQDIKCDRHVIMPNHFHAIIQNVGADVGTDVGADMCVCPNGDGIPKMMDKNTKSIQIIFITLALSLLGSFASAGQFRVKWIYDGDTFKAEGNDIEIVVRFAAIDAPEISYRKGEPSQPFSDKSKRMLMDLILNKTVDIKGYGLDKQNRVLAVVYYGGRNIGVEMIREGLAEIYRGELPERLDLGDYRQAEFQARTSRKGMWNQGDAYVSPREWRERERRR